MTYALLAAGALLIVGLLVRRLFLIMSVDGTSMEPTLRSGDRLLVRRTKRIRTGQVVVFKFGDLPSGKAPVARRSRRFLIKRAVAIAGDRIPAVWEWPDVHQLAGTVVPSGSFVVPGDTRAASWDSRHQGFIGRDRFVGVAIRHLGSATPRPEAPSRSIPRLLSGQPLMPGRSR